MNVIDAVGAYVTIGNPSEHAGQSHEFPLGRVDAVEVTKCVRECSGSSMNDQSKWLHSESGV
jgi:hypothetical protein